MNKGKVIAGDYKNYNVVAYWGKCYFTHRLQRIKVNKSVVARFEIISDVNRHPFWSTLVKGAIGRAVFGTLGAASAISSSLNKKVYIISIEFKNGRRSLIKVSDLDYVSVLRAIY